MSTNIQDALLRISQLRDKLASHGKTLGLNLTDSAAEDFTGTKSTLQQIVDEFNSIVRGTISTTGANTTVNNSIYQVDNLGTVEFSAGYYPESWIVTGLNSDADQAAAVAKAIQDLYKEIQTSVTATPSTALSGTKIPVVSVKGDGPELKIEYVEGTIPTQTRSTTETVDNKVVYVEHPEVKVSTQPEDKDNNVTLDTITIAAGYYDKDIVITPKVKVDGSTPENVINTQEFTVKGASSTGFTPEDGYDYITKVIVPESGREISTSITGNVVTLTETGNAGWSEKTKFNASNDVTTSYENGIQTVKITLPTVNVDNVVAEVVGKDTDNNANTPEEVYVSIPAGYYDSGAEIPLKVTVGTGEEATTNVVALNPSNTGNVTVTGTETKTATVGVSAGLYTTDSSIEIATVGEQTLGIKNGNVTLTTNTAGWVEAGTVDLNNNDFVSIADTLVDTGTSVDPETQQTITSPVGVDNVDENGIAKNPDSTAGQVVFTYDSNLDEATNGIQIKVPGGNSRYFTSAKVDLSDLITIIDQI